MWQFRDDFFSIKNALTENTQKFYGYGSVADVREKSQLKQLLVVSLSPADGWAEKDCSLLGQLMPKIKDAKGEISADEKKGHVVVQLTLPTFVGKFVPIDRLGKK